MKRFLLSLSLCFCVFILTSCEEPNNGSIGTPEDSSFYYIKYEVESYSGTNVVTINTDTGEERFSLRPNRSYSEIYGPVSRGFEASIKNQASITTRIYVSKNNGPFALKANGEGSAFYIINF